MVARTLDASVTGRHGPGLFMAALALGAALLLSACGGGDDDPAAPAAAFRVDASLPGFAQASTRSGEAAATLAVEAWNLDVATLEVTSSVDTGWSVEPADAPVTATTDTPTRRVFDLSALPPGSVTLVLRDAASAAEARLTITVQADATRYAPAPRRVGETFSYRYTDLRNGVETSYEPTSTVTAFDPPSWNYQTLTPAVAGGPTGLDDQAWFTAGGNLYDENFLSGPGTSIVGSQYRREWRGYDFPLYAGKQWHAEFLYFFDDEFFTATVYEASRVAGVERVTVAAGTYDAVRVDTRGAAYTGLSLLVPLRESDRPFETYERSCWWAPQLSIEVRCTTTTRKYNELDGTFVATVQSTKELTAHTAP